MNDDIFQLDPPQKKKLTQEPEVTRNVGNC